MEQETIGEKLLSDLNRLRLSLNEICERLENSGVDRTAGLKRTMGRDCSYYRKSLDLFLKKDYEDLRDLVYSIKEKFDTIEGTTDDPE